MAIYHLSMQIISRSKGQSAVAAASYRSGDRLIDERTGEEKFYRRDAQPDTMILAPSNSPEWVYDRNRLWNEVEKVEMRKDSQLAREMNIALPRELFKDQQRELIRSFVQDQFVNKGMIADMAIHRDDPNNPHVHVMLTMRTIDENGFGKKNRDWNADFANSKENTRGFVKSSDNCLDIRERWAAHANKELEKVGAQDRISHLSHEARGLEQLPTVHLGHVANDMEKRGVKTDRGNLNRDRKEYNALVVDLQKYREEKKALEQEKARRQEQKQKAERFYLAVERVDVENASKLLKAEASLTNIKKRYVQLDKWEERINNGDQYLRWKDEKLREAAEHFRWFNSFETKIQEAEKRIENINWLNPLKLKENRIAKEREERDIAKAKDQIKFHDEKLNYHREKLKFTNEDEFNQVKDQHDAELPGLLKKNRNERQHIHNERVVLQAAEKAHKNAFVRQVASLYPERPEMRYISLQTAMKLADIIKGQKHPVPIENIEKNLNSRKQEIKRLQGEISRVDHTKSRLQRAKGYLENYEKYQAIVEKYENNPFLKGKILVSKSAKQEYDNAVSACDNYKEYMKKEGISGRGDFEKQVEQLGKMEIHVPRFEEQIRSQEMSFGIFEAVLQGIEQAGKEMQKERKKTKETPFKKKKKKQRTMGIER